MNPVSLRKKQDGYQHGKWTLQLNLYYTEKVGSQADRGQ